MLLLTFSALVALCIISSCKSLYKNTVLTHYSISKSMLVMSFSSPLTSESFIHFSSFSLQKDKKRKSTKEISQETFEQATSDEEQIKVFVHIMIYSANILVIYIIIHFLYCVPLISTYNLEVLIGWVYSLSHC